jgi:tetratricopeptide (TPR) repeat protein
MPPDEAKEFIVKLLGDERKLSETELTELAETCLRHPLSLKVAALFLKTYKGRGVAAFIVDVQKDPARLRLEGQLDFDVVAVVGQSLRQLEVEDAALAEHWRDLAVFPAAFDGAAAAAVWALEGEDAGVDSLCRLEARGLIEAISEDRYRLHDLLRDIAARDWPEERQASAAQRHAQHFVSVLARANELYLQGGSALRRGLALWERERANIEAGQRWAAARLARSDKAANLAAAYAHYGVHVLNLRLHPREQIAWHEAALAGSRNIRNRRTEGNALGNLGIVYAELGEPRKAIEHYKQVLTIHRELGDRRGEGATLGNLGNAYQALGKTRTAIEYHKQDLEVERKISNRRGEGNALSNLGTCYNALGETKEAIEHLEQSRAVFRDIGDPRGEGAALGNLGNAYRHLGEMEKAIESYERALVIDRGIGDRRGEGIAHANLGSALESSDPAAARAHWEQALAIYTEIEDPRAAHVAKWLAQLDKSDGPETQGRQGASDG